MMNPIKNIKVKQSEPQRTEAPVYLQNIHIAYAIDAKSMETTSFYLFSTFVVSYATSGTLQYERFDVLNAVTIATLVTTFCIPLMGLQMPHSDPSNNIKMPRTRRYR